VRRLAHRYSLGPVFISALGPASTTDVILSIRRLVDMGLEASGIQEAEAMKKGGPEAARCSNVGPKIGPKQSPTASVQPQHGRMLDLLSV